MIKWALRRSIRWGAGVAVLLSAGCESITERITEKAMEVAERAVILRLGKVIWDGKPADITHDELGELFLTGKMRGEAEAPH